MIKKYNVLLISIGISLVIYLIDALNLYLFSDLNVTFPEALITGIPSYEIFKRFLIAAIVIVFGFYVFEKNTSMVIEKKISKIVSAKAPEGRFDSEFLAYLLFQIRIPLTTIAGFSVLLKNKKLSEESKELYIRYINSSSNYLLLLIKNISDLSRIESGQLAIAYSECNINRMMGNLLDEFKIRREETGKADVEIILNSELEGSGITIITDPGRLKQVIDNLFEIALSFIFSGTIEIGYNITGSDLLEFYIKYSGQEMSRDEIDTILKHNDKLSDSDNQSLSGSMLLLAISKSLVRLLEGDIRADLNSGEVTTILFTLPYTVVGKPAEESLKAKVASAESKDWSDRCVLIVEDVESNFIYLQEVLRPTKIKVIWAKNGIEAIELMKNKQNMDIILMDILMPGMDGIEASKEIKKLNSRIPIIAQTAFVFEKESDNEQIKYFDGYLTKPIWSPQLIGAIEKYIN